MSVDKDGNNQPRKYGYVFYEQWDLFFYATSNSMSLLISELLLELEILWGI